MSANLLFALALVVVSLIFWIYTFIILYHLIRFGIGRLPKQISIATLIGSLVLFSWLLYTYNVITLP